MVSDLIDGEMLDSFSKSTSCEFSPSPAMAMGSDADMDTSGAYAD